MIYENVEKVRKNPLPVEIQPRGWINVKRDWDLIREPHQVAGNSMRWQASRPYKNL